MILISNKDDCHNSCYRVYTIDRDNKERYKKIKDLVPSKSFTKKWNEEHKKHMNYLRLKEYITDYYYDTLKDLNPKDTYLEIPNNSVLLSGNKNDIFSHNMIAAYWFELFLDVDIKHVKIDGYKLELKENRNIIKEILEKVIKQSNDTLGYNSLKAYQLHKESELVKRRAIDMKYAGFNNEELIKLSEELLKSALDEEEAYNTNGRSRKLVK